MNDHTRVGPGPKADTADVMRARAWGASGRARQLRMDARLTLREVAALLNVHFTTVQAWETGHRRPRGPVAAAYGRLLDDLQRHIEGLA